MGSVRGHSRGGTVLDMARRSWAQGRGPLTNVPSRSRGEDSGEAWVGNEKSHGVTGVALTPPRRRVQGDGGTVGVSTPQRSQPWPLLPHRFLPGPLRLHWSPRCSGLLSGRK